MALELITAVILVGLSLTDFLLVAIIGLTMTISTVAIIVDYGDTQGIDITTQDLLI